MSKVTKQQTEEWVENPVTEAFKQYAIHEREQILNRRGIDAFCAFDAHKTQELMANLNGALSTWNEIIDALEGDWDEEENYEE